MQTATTTSIASTAAAPYSGDRNLRPEPVSEHARLAAPSRRGVEAASLAADDLERSLAIAWRLVDSGEAFAAQLGLGELGDVDLPPITGSDADRAHLQAAVPLYLASELEAARLLPAVETLAGLFATGAFTADLGPAAPLLAEYWQGRRDRFSAAERQALFARLFGTNAGPPLAVTGGRNTAFESLMIDLAELLASVGRAESGLSGDVRLRTVAKELAANLIPLSGGLALFASRELLGTIQRALAIVKVPAVQRAVGAQSVWAAVSSIARTYLNDEPNVAAHVTRGKAGLELLAWLADVVSRLDDFSERIVAPSHPAVAAAWSWLQASLAIHERHGD